MQPPSTSVLASSLLAVLTACGGADTKPAAEPSEAAESKPTAEPETPKTATAEAETPPEEEAGMPEACAEVDGDLCLPPADFVKKLCRDDYPSVAVAMFQAGTPWTRGYLAGEVEAWNASGGGGSRETLPRGEEVIILRHRGASTPGGVKVSGASGGYDVLRWDGLCVTLQEGHIRFEAPREPKNARVIWKSLELDMRDALEEDEAIHDMYVEHRKECKGVSIGRVSKKCEKIDRAFSALLAEHIREEGGLPEPNKLPE